MAAPSATATECSPVPLPAAAPVPSTSGLLDVGDRRRLGHVRRFGTAGALLLAVAALGAGAVPAPADNPLLGLRLLGLPARMPTVSLTLAYAGMAMVVFGWLWLGRLDRPGWSVSRRQLQRTTVMWAVPLAVAPPLFSDDVYSYLAQSEITSRGLDPYLLGPAQALGVNNPLTVSVSTVWRNTPAPYGPVFLTLGRAVSWVAGTDVVLGVLLERVLALAGLVLVVWALPRLASRFGVEPVRALWLGAANPLVLFHLVSGAHNEALMLGLMLAGLELGLARGAWLGAVVITLAAAVKLPAGLALAFLAGHGARVSGGRPRQVVRAAGGVGGLAVAVMALASFGSGLGLGWIRALDVPDQVRSWISVPTELGVASGGLGVLAGVGNHTDAILALTQALGLTAAGVVCCWMLVAVLRGRVGLLTGLGVALGALVLFGPALQPWYLLWAALPLAAAADSSRYRRWAVALSVVLAVLLPPTGANFDFRSYQLPMAIVAAGLAVVAPLYLVRKHIPRVSAARPPGVPG